ncbi:MAG: DNA-protecting protein DprA, partial [Candidatus Dadabacteria bacterium]|nr:DNA-protecting protein DprA [Candidatus Dadabacteria bacterium]NIQ13279.1 DNA-protecting protein DprA [Candidatus Dadabacteria bacterium]
YGFKILTFLEKEYPRNLLNIYNPPTVIYCFGNIKEQDNSSISIVGSRNGNKYGKSVTKQISEGLVKNGITIISGMERGIDTFAHQEAIRSGGRTIAVLGSGLNEVYPPENIKLYKQISENGAVISEFPLGVRPEANNFPKRNRVISGLSLGVVIVQASKKSGSLITADYALEQNREVFAVPGNIDSKLSEGTNILIKKGAKLVQNVEDILDEFKCFGNQKVKMSTKNNSDISRLTKDEIKVLELLSSRAHYFDEIVGSLRIDNGRIFKLLLNMEIKGLIYNLPGNLYQAR